MYSSVDCLGVLLLFNPICMICDIFCNRYSSHVIPCCQKTDSTVEPTPFNLRNELKKEGYTGPTRFHLLSVIYFIQFDSIIVSASAL